MLLPISLSTVIFHRMMLKLISKVHLRFENDLILKGFVAEAKLN